MFCNSLRMETGEWRTLLVPVRRRHAELSDGVALEVELDHHDRFLPHDPAVMSRVDGDDLRRSQFDDAAVRVLDVDLAMSQEPDVRVHAQIGAGHRLHVGGPVKSDW